MKTASVLGVASLFILASCQTDVLEENSTNFQASTTSSYKMSGGCSETFTLYGGQTIPVGTLEVSNDADSIYVVYTTTGGWELVETQLYVGDLAGLPANKNGMPKIGQFPYKANHSGSTTTYSYSIPVDDNISCYSVAAHASVQLVQGGTVVQSETAWSEGVRLVSKGSWATYSTYCLTDCCQISTASYDMFGGQTIPLGTLQVTNDATNLYVTFTYSGAWSTQQTHLYVGDLAGLPVNKSNTPIPGQFPYSTAHTPGTTSYTYTIPLANLDPCYIIAAHSEAIIVDASGAITQSETSWSYGTQFPNTNRWGWYSDYCTQTCQ